MRLFLFFFFGWLVIASMLGQPPYDTAQVTQLNLQSASLWRSKPDSSNLLAKKALKLSHKLQYVRGKAYSYKNLGASFLFLGQLDSSEHYFQKYLDAAITLDDDTLISKAYVNLAAIFQRSQQFTKALQYSESGLEYKLRIQDSLGLAIGYNNIAAIYHETEHYQKALEFHQKAKYIRERLQDSARIHSTYLNLGIVFYHLEKYDSAKLLMKKSLKLKLKASDTWGVAINYASLGDVHRDQNELDTAIYYYEKAISKAQDIDSKNLIFNFYLEIIGIRIQQQKYKEANLLLEALKSKWQVRPLQKQLHYFLLLAKVESHFLRTEAANRAFRKHLSLRDSIDKVESKKAFADAQVRLYTTLKENELKLENEKREYALLKDIEYRKRTNYLLAIVSIVTLVLLIILFRNYRSLKRSNTLLTQQQNTIQALLKQKNELLHKKTSELLSSKRIIDRYAFLNSHELRAPVAKILGMLNIIEYDQLEEKDILSMLSANINEIDMVVKKIATELDKD